MSVEVSAGDKGREKTCGPVGDSLFILISLHFHTADARESDKTPVGTSACMLPPAGRR